MSGSPTATIEETLAFLDGRRLVVLTGAGVSTDSGIPDYRGPRPEGTRIPQPMTYQEFVATPAAQQRYWARAHVGWPRMCTAEPNAGHHALATLQAGGRIELLITQNVDGLHERAGSTGVVTLHGRISDVVCLDCRQVTGRARLQDRMTALNPGWVAAHAHLPQRPDADIDLEETRDFVVPTCTACGGRLKPDVVFFGENVPASRVQRCFAAVDALDRADALLVAGSSLAVMSGLRFVKRAAKAGVPVVIVNRGHTRGDSMASRTLWCGTSEFLQALAPPR